MILGREARESRRLPEHKKRYRKQKNRETGTASSSCAEALQGNGEGKASARERPAEAGRHAAEAAGAGMYLENFIQNTDLDQTIKTSISVFIFILI